MNFEAIYVKNEFLVF